MIPLIKHFAKRLLWDEGAVTGYVRGGALGVALAWQQGGLSWPPDGSWVTPILGAFAGMIRAGDKNPKGG